MIRQEMEGNEIGVNLLTVIVIHWMRAMQD